jgi:hypothetical protein
LDVGALLLAGSPFAHLCKLAPHLLHGSCEISQLTGNGGYVFTGCQRRQILCAEQNASLRAAATRRAVAGGKPDAPAATV